MDFETYGIQPENRREIRAIDEVVIGNNGWIGNAVILLKSTKIGDNSIVAAGAVVFLGNFHRMLLLGVCQQR